MAPHLDAHQTVFTLEGNGLAEVLLREPGLVAALHRNAVPGQPLGAGGNQVQARGPKHEPGRELEQHHPEQDTCGADGGAGMRGPLSTGPCSMLVLRLTAALCGRRRPGSGLGADPVTPPLAVRTPFWCPGAGGNGRKRTNWERFGNPCCGKKVRNPRDAHRP